MKLKSLILTAAIFAAMSAHAEEIVVYSNWAREAMDQLKQDFESANPGTTMTYYRAAGAELSTQFLSEQQLGTGKADYIISDVDFLEIFKERGYLKASAPAELSRFNPDALDGDGVWVPIDFAPYVIVYNTKAVSEADAPKAWTDITDPKWTGKIGLADPRTSAGIQIPLTFWTRDLAAQGSPYGWPFVEALGKLRPTLVSGHRQLVDLVVTGEVAIAGQMPLSFIAAAIEKGEPVKIAWPAEGSPATINGGAIVEGAQHPEGAQKMHDYLASLRGQQFLSDHWGSLPSHKDAKFETPDGKTLADITIKRVLIPQDLRTSNTKTFLEYMQ